MLQLKSAAFLGAFFFTQLLTAQSGPDGTANTNPKIKCYFNRSVNTGVSSGVNAVYLNGTFDDTLAAYFNRAKYTIDVAQYDFTGSSASNVKVIATAANKAFLRGVIIRWIYNGGSNNSGLNMLNSNIHTLGSPTTSGYGIMHDKFVAIDANSANAGDAVLITGSYDWSDQQTTSDYNNMVVIQDQPMTKAFYQEFNKMWGGTGAAPNSAASAFGPNKTASATTSFMVNGTPVEVYFSPKDDAGTHLKSSIATANFDLHFGIYTFTDNSIATAIKNKYSGSVAGFGIMDAFSVSYSPYTTLNSFMGNNLKVYDGGNNSIYHNKMMLIDALHPASDPQVVTGSFNWTISGESSNDENMIVIHDATIANQYYQSICKNFTDAGGAPCTPVVADEEPADGRIFRVFPNPFIDVINLRSGSPGGADLTLRLTDAVGHVLTERRMQATGEMQMRLPELPNGMYFMHVLEGGQVFVYKLIRQER